MRATAALVVVVLAVAGCSADDGSATSVTASTNGSSATSVATTTTAPPPPATTASTSGLSRTSVATNHTAPPPATTVSATPCGMLATGVSRTTLDAGGGTHSVQVFVPTSFAGSPLPVVIDWHGLGSDGPQQATYSDYEVVAEEEGFIVVHPTGLADTRRGPNSWQLYPTPGSGLDDLAFAGARPGLGWVIDAAGRRLVQVGRQPVVAASVRDEPRPIAATREGALPEMAVAAAATASQPAAPDVAVSVAGSKTTRYPP